MKTLFGERKSVKTLAFILALALILPLLPVMSVGADTTNVKIIHLLGGGENGNFVYYDENYRLIYTNATGDTAANVDDEFPVQLGTVKNWQWRTENSNADIVLTTTSAQKKAPFIYVEEAEGKDIKVSWSSTNGEDYTPISQSENGSYALPLKAENGELYVKAEVITTVNVTVENRAGGDVYINSDGLQAGVNKVEQNAQYSLSLDVAEGKEAVVSKREKDNGKFGAWNIVSDDLSKLTFTKDTEIKIESKLKEYTVEYTGGGATNATGPKKVNHGDTLEFNVDTPAGKQAPSVTVTVNKVATPTTRTPYTGGYTYKIANVTGAVTVEIGSPAAITHDLTKAPTNDDRFTITYTQKGAEKDSVTDTIDEGNSLIVAVTPKSGYKVQNITVKASDRDAVLGSTTADTITVTNIRENVSVTVDVVPITITVKVNNGGDLNGSYVFKYGESGFNTDLISWGELPKSNAAFNKDKIDDLVKLVQGFLNKNPDGIPTRFGFDFDREFKGTEDQTVSKGWIIADESLKLNPNADVTITLTGNWKPNFTELFVLKTTTVYETGNGGTLSFVSTLEVNESVDEAAKNEYGSATVKVNSYGVFFGEFPTSLNNDFTLVGNVRKFINDHKNTTISNGIEATTDLWGSNATQRGRVFFYSTNRSTNQAEFQVSGNTITETFQEKEKTAQRSGITWIEIEYEGQTVVIVGPATEYRGA